MPDQPKNTNVIDEVQQQQVPDVPAYLEEEIQYLGGLQVMLERDRDVRESQHDELDGMTYSQYWESNEKGANTYIEPKKNREDSTYQSGTIRRKLFSFLAEILKFEFYADVTAFDKNDLEVRALGNSVEDAIAKGNELDGDEEKRYLRQYELIKQGDVFLEKIWDEQFTKEKKFKGAKFDGKVSGISITTKWRRKIAKPSTRIISGLNVYLGNIREYDFANQPHIFTVEIMDYSAAEAKYKNWERWPHVAKTLQQFFPNRDRSLIYNNWRLLDHQKNKVECIKFQNKPDNEFALILNGVLMTPVGLPLPWGYEDYNIVNQHLKPIHAKFALGASLVKELRGNVAMYDDLIRVMHLRNWQALLPARFNLTGRTVSRRVFMPSAITAGIDPRQLPLADERAAQGIGASEYKFVEMLMDNIDKNSVGPIPSGQQPEGDPTATEVLEISRQSKTMLNNLLIACSLLEWKLSWLSLYTVLAKWFDPTGDKVDDARQQLVKTYRTYSVSRPIRSEGMGYRVTVPVADDQNLPTADEVKALEDQKLQETGIPYSFTFLKATEINLAKWVWQITIRTKPKANDEISKMMFNKMVSDAMNLFGPDVNLPELEAEYAVMWDRDPKKFFLQGAPPQMLQAGTPKTANGITPPSPNQQLGKMLSSAVNPQ